MVYAEATSVLPELRLAPGVLEEVQARISLACGEPDKPKRGQALSISGKRLSPFSLFGMRSR